MYNNAIKLYYWRRKQLNLHLQSFYFICLTKCDPFHKSNILHSPKPANIFAFPLGFSNFWVSPTLCTINRPVRYWGRNQYLLYASPCSISIMLWARADTCNLTQRKKCTITKTCLYNFDHLKPHLHIVKLGFTGVYIIFLISAQKHRLWVFVRTASPRRF